MHCISVNECKWIYTDRCLIYKGSGCISVINVINAQVQAVEEELIVHVNSAGGDVFAGLTINNLLRTRNSTAIIEGLCASAATVAIMSAKKIIMAENALMMIHAPSLLLFDYYNSQELSKLQTTLEKLEEAIVATYKARNPDFEMPQDELWLNAQEALALKLIDEISGSVELKADAAQKLMFVNGLFFNLNSCKKFPAIENKPRLKDRAEKIILDQLKSGSHDVTGALGDVKSQAALIVKYANASNANR